MVGEVQGGDLHALGVARELEVLPARVAQPVAEAVHDSRPDDDWRDAFDGSTLETRKTSSRLPAIASV